MNTINAVDMNAAIFIVTDDQRFLEIVDGLFMDAQAIDHAVSDFLINHENCSIKVLDEFIAQAAACHGVPEVNIRERIYNREMTCLHYRTKDNVPGQMDCVFINGGITLSRYGDYCHANIAPNIEIRTEASGITILPYPYTAYAYADSGAMRRGIMLLPVGAYAGGATIH